VLARLLRLLLILEIALGAVLGYLLQRYASDPVCGAVWFALLGPVLTCAVSILITGIKSRDPASAALWWRSVWGEIRASMLIFLLRQPWTYGTPGPLSAESNQPARVPVVLVHGYVCNHRLWDTMARALRAQGHAVLAVNLEPVFTSIDNYTPLVEAAVTALRRHTGAPQVALLGHSMGGLAIRAWMRKHGHAQVARVLTLGTPHAGTQLARNTHTPNGQQMCWQSPWLAELAAHESADARALMRIGLTAHDNIVYPQRAQVLPDVPTTVFEGIGHLRMCLHPDVIAWVQRQLA